MQIKITTALKAPKDANYFLRALWAELRIAFGSLSGAYAPHRDGGAKTISFGQVQLGGKDILDVNIGYITKGSLEYIEFSDSTTSLRGEISDHTVFKSVERCVYAALDKYQRPRTYYLSTALSLSTSRSFYPYKADWVAIRPTGHGRAELRLRVEAFDDLDAEREFLITAPSICDQLTTWTNVLVKISSDRTASIGSDEQISLPENCTWAESDWIDGAPLIDGRIALTRDQLLFLSAFAKGIVGETHPLFRATRHFAESLAIQDAGYFPEICQTLLVSALEVVGGSAAQAKNCPHCGQEMYKISARIYELAKVHLGEFAAKRIKTFYTHRSKFLHAGVLPGRHPHTRGTSPQLDPADPTGCVVLRSGRADINLVEFTSFILRAECKLWSTELSSARFTI